MVKTPTLKQILSSILIAVLLFSSFAAMPLHADSTQDQAKQMIEKTMKQSKQTAVAAATVDQEHVAYYLAGDLVKEDSLFCIGSLSKAFTAYAIFLLLEENWLALDDSINTYIPWFEAWLDGVDMSQSIRIQDLLNQTSGITDPNNTLGKDSETDLEHSIRALSGLSLSVPPQETFIYANANYNLLGYIIEVVNNKPYARYMEDHIFHPLGLAHTFATTVKDQSSIIEGTRISFTRALPYSYPISVTNMPSGYIYSSIKDMLRWGQIHLGVIDLDEPYQSALLQAKGIDHGSMVDKDTLYTAGWFKDVNSNRRYHSGGTPNYSTSIILDPSEVHASIVLTNMNASKNTDDMAKNLIHLLEGNEAMVYSFDIWLLLDFIFTSMSLFCLLIYFASMLCLLYTKIEAYTLHQDLESLSTDSVWLSIS